MDTATIGVALSIVTTIVAVVSFFWKLADVKEQLNIKLSQLEERQSIHREMKEL